jgi:hypothetical protein
MFARQDPPLPRNTQTLFYEAKAAEREGDIDRALELYRRAVNNNIHFNSAVKDFAGLLHMTGRTAEAIEFLRSHHVTDRLGRLDRGYVNLLKQLEEAAINAHLNRDSPRAVVVEVLSDPNFVIDKNSIRSIVPNYHSVIRIDNISGRKNRAVLEFNTTSAARRAINTNRDGNVRVQWAPPGTQHAEDPAAFFPMEDDWQRLFQTDAAPPSQPPTSPVTRSPPASVITRSPPTSSVIRSPPSRSVRRARIDSSDEELDRYLDARSRDYWTTVSTLTRPQYW